MRGISRFVAVFSAITLLFSSSFAGIWTAGEALGSLISQQLRGKPGPFTERPTKPNLGANPGRTKNRGGMWSAKALKAAEESQKNPEPELSPGEEMPAGHTLAVSADPGGPLPVASALILAIYSLNMIFQSQGSFEVKFAGFYGDRLYPYKLDDVERRGLDVTSLLKNKRDAILSILGKASKSGKTADFDGAMLIDWKGKRWLVGREGDVQLGKQRFLLDPKELYGLKKLVFESMPPPEESLRWREETKAGQMAMPTWSRM